MGPVGLLDDLLLFSMQKFITGILLFYDLLYP